MSVSTIRSDIKAKLISVPEVKNVKDFIIWDDDWRNIVQRFISDGRLHTWFIGWNNSLGNLFKRNAIQRFYTWNVVGYYSIKTKDESSKVFEGIVEKVMNEFTKSINFLSTAGSTRPMMLQSLQSVPFNNTPAHRAILTIDIDENKEEVRRNYAGN